MSCLTSQNNSSSEIPLLQKITVRTGRHVDGIRFTLSSQQTHDFGNLSGGEQEHLFLVDGEKLEYIVRIVGRQGKHLDGVQFVTNRGRHSRWFGGDGGQPFEIIVPPGEMIVGLANDTEEAFCPCILQTSLIVSTAPILPKVSLLWLLLNKNTRKLTFSSSKASSPSLFKLSRKRNRRLRQRSVIRLVLEGGPKNPSLLRLMMRGEKLKDGTGRSQPSIIRSVLSGEEYSRKPFSLYRLLCQESSFPAIKGRSLMQVLLDSGNKDIPSLMQLFLTRKMSSKASVARTLLSSGMGRKLFDHDNINGYPSIVQLVIEKDATGMSLMEALMLGEEMKGREPSLLRLMLVGSPSILEMLLQIEGKSKESLMELMVKDLNNNNKSIARKILTSFEDAKGFRASLAKYAVEGEARAVPSILRLLLSGEDKKDDQPSILRLLMLRYEYEYNEKRKQPKFLKMDSSVRMKPDPVLDIAAELDMQVPQLESQVSVIPKADLIATESNTVPGRNLAHYKENFTVQMNKEELNDSDDEVDEDMLQEVESQNVVLDTLAQIEDKITSKGEKVQSVASTEGSQLVAGNLYVKKSLLQVMLLGKPCIFDLFLEGELEGEDSLARLFLGLNFVFDKGSLRVEQNITLTTETDEGKLENGKQPLQFCLLKLMLMGEEAGGPGISFMRLLIQGEQDSGFSILRLLLINEANGMQQPSLLRIILMAVKVILNAAKKRKNTLIQETIIQPLKELIVGPTDARDNKPRGFSFSEFASQISSLTSTVMNGFSYYNEIFEILKTIPSRGKEFEALWKSQFYRASFQMQKVKDRVADEKSMWKVFAPSFAKLLKAVGEQNWPKALKMAPDVLLTFGKLVNEYRLKALDV